jgi:hypothetical protein
MISYGDENSQMPPEGKLPPDALATLNEWVLAGMPWPHAEPPEVEEESMGSHGKKDGLAGWSYVPVVRPPVPQVRSQHLVRNPIDAFILARLEAEDLTPSRRADSRTLMRRASLGLLGLPPSPEAAEAFAVDPSEDAYDQLIDRLLSSPHYGERIGKMWLDLVRYAETNGFERDSDKPFMWRYRDYVIQSFNEDKPYDQFVREQLAGDELQTVTKESLIATGYYRLMPWDDEPGALALQARFDVLDDIVSTTSQAMLGMTIGCARCHDHVADPISQKDYYRFLAFFSGVTDMSVDRHLVPVESAEEATEYERRRKEKEETEANFVTRIRDIEDLFCETYSRAHATSALSTSPLRDLRYRLYRDTFTTHPKFDALKPETEGDLPDGFVDLSVATRTTAVGLVYEGLLQVPEAASYTFVATSSRPVRLLLADKEVLKPRHRENKRPQLGTVELKAGLTPLRLEVAYGDEEAALALHYHRSDGETWRITTTRPEGDWTSPTFVDRGWDARLPGFGSYGTHGAVIRTEWKTPEIWLRRTFRWDLAAASDLRLAIQHDDHVEVYLNGVLAFQARGYITSYQLFELRKEALSALKDGENVLAVHCTQDFGGQSIHVEPVSFAAANRGLSAEELAFGHIPLSRHPLRHDTEGFQSLMERRATEFLPAQTVEKWRRLNRELEESKKRRIPRKMAPAVQETGPKPERTFVHVRGNAHVHGAEVRPTFPSALGGGEPEIRPRTGADRTSGRRLALAEWLTRRDHPLFARVMVNRLWRQHFGHGLIESLNDFGELGERPTHPELLDWLAAEFVEGGFRIKPIQRLILTSATYMQVTQGSPETRMRDPLGTLYSRMPLRRLDAEEVRDGILTTAGQLNPRLYGPSFFAPMPAAALATSSTPHSIWGVARPEDLGRRSIYIKVKRSLLLPMLVAFDLADSDLTCPSRFATTQPSQALALLNGRWAHEMAEHFAARLREFAPDQLEQQVRRALVLTTAQTPTDEEVREDLDFLHSLAESLNGDRDRALQLYALLLWNTNAFLYVP